MRGGNRLVHGIVALGLVAPAPAGLAWAGEPFAVTAAPHLGACGPVQGAYQLPGTDACLRLSGFVAADVGAWHMPTASIAGVQAAVSPRTTAADVSRSAIAADARISADVRLPTDYGPARVYLSVWARHGVPSSLR